MLIVCPACASEYRIEADRVGMEGRSVRCAACRETWFIAPAEVLAGRAEELDIERYGPESGLEAAWQAAAAEERQAERQAEAAVLDNVPPRPRARSAARAAGRRKSSKSAKPARRRGLAGISPAAAAGLAALALLPLMLLARTTVVRAMPQTAGLYARIGLPVNLRGLELRDVVAFRGAAEPGRAGELVVEADLVGLARGGVPVPVIEVEVRDAADRPLKTFTAPAPRAALGEAERARFRATFADPPAQGRSVEIRFAAAAPPSEERPAAHP
ncbi:zinc-ribbon domain-containing protein [Methylobacterium nigriterrae]|uniref:zinc-ribbon domain-containing protein n=1 Tax=Methylobacterium nigriterrae TaxID=3127512 RepID=UPI0030132084